jgi:hypothetical protein
MTPQQRLAKRAQIYHQQDLASDHGPGRPPGPGGRRLVPRATGHAALMRRLRKGFPELHKLALAGVLTVAQAATAAGLLHRRGHQPPPPAATGHEHAAILMELWLGPNHHGSVFTNNDTRRRAWDEHREQVMRWWGTDGRRPQAWWKYESPIPYPGYAWERSTLYEHGLLGVAEARVLVADWRAEFERASQPDFAYVAGPGEIYQGALARQKHFAWANIPSALVQQWEAACQRAG